MSAADGVFGGIEEGLAATVTAPSAEGVHTVLRSRLRYGLEHERWRRVRHLDRRCRPAGCDRARPLSHRPGRPERAGSCDWQPPPIGIAVASAQVSVDGGPWMALAASGRFVRLQERERRGSRRPRGCVGCRCNRSCASLRDGELWCWGSNSVENSGNGTDDETCCSGPARSAGRRGHIGRLLPFLRSHGGRHSPLHGYNGMASWATARPRTARRRSP